MKISPAKELPIEKPSSDDLRDWLMIGIIFIVTSLLVWLPLLVLVWTTPRVVFAHWEHSKIDLNNATRVTDDIDLLNGTGQQGWESYRKGNHQFD
jgi:hypothetical protein